MIEKILVATDGSDHARKAVDYACDLALKYNATVYLLHVIHRSDIPKEVFKYIKAKRIEELLQEIGNRIIEVAEREAKRRGVKNFRSAIVKGDPVESITEFARENSVDMIVMGSRGLGSLEGLLLGSVSHKVCHLAPCTCVTVK